MEVLQYSSTFSTAERKEIEFIIAPLLPESYSVYITDFMAVKRSAVFGETKFTSTFRVNVDSEDEIDHFITEFGQKSGTAYNRFKGDQKGKGKKVIVSGARKCQHKVVRHALKDGPTHSGSGRQPGDVKIPGKNTSCPAKIKFSLSGERLHTSNRFNLSLTKKLMTKYPLQVSIDFTHNHSINSADALKYRPVSEGCKNKFLDLFKQDHTPSSALAQYKKEIQGNHNDAELMTIMADRSVVPDYMWAFHFHRKYVESTFGSLNGPDAYNLAKERVQNYNDKHGSEVSKLEVTPEGEVIVAICDTFCRRVHEHVPQAGDIVLVDATSNLDRQDTKLFHLVCPSPVGGLPLGSILTSKEDEVTIYAALTLFRSILPKSAFFGRGPNTGPKIIMTDDSAAERNALKKVWPNLTLLLCVFHLLQAFWRWLWNSDHEVGKQDRSVLFNLLKALVYVKTDSDFEEKKAELLSHKTMKKYNTLIDHLKNDMLPRKDEWSLAYRFKHHLATHNVNTTNYAEVSFRLTKENQFNRVKAYNLPDLLDIILDDSIYYINRCIDVGNNRTAQFRYQKSRYFAKNCNIDAEKIVALDGEKNTYLVPSETITDKYYVVNMDLMLCECPQGMLKGPCKHKHVVAETFNVLCADILPCQDPRVRAFYHFLATGQNKNANWYRALIDQEEVEQEGGQFQGVFDYMKSSIDGDDHAIAHTSSEEAQNNEEGETDGILADNVESFEHQDNDLKQEFMKACESFSAEVVKRLETDFDYYSKPVASFTNKLQNTLTANSEIFKKVLYSFGREINFSTKKGRRKTGKRINVQSTSISRRLYKARGRTQSRKGRPGKDIVPKKRGSEPVSFCLPQSKKMKKAHPHSLSRSVAANRAAEKKH